MNDNDAISALRVELQEAQNDITLLRDELKETRLHLEQSQRDVQALRRLITRLLEQMV